MGSDHGSAPDDGNRSSRSAPVVSGKPILQ